MFKVFSPINSLLKVNNLRSIRTSIQSHHINGKMFSTSPITKKQGFNNFGNFKYQSRSYAHQREKPNMGLTFLGVLGISSLYLVAHKPILNDAGFANPPVTINTGKGANVYYDDTKPKFDGAFNGKLNYHQVAMGSMAGLILGYALSRLSSILFVFTITFYVISIYLRKQGIVVIDTKSVFKSAVNSVSWDELVFDQTSFSVPFVMSFLTAATL